MEHDDPRDEPDDDPCHEPGHEPDETHDRDFAPVNRDSDARGRTVPGGRATGRTSGTGVPGVTREHPDTLPPDEEGVEEAERHDDSR
jgi:hypothetical protein